MDLSGPGIDGKLKERKKESVPVAMKQTTIYTKRNYMLRASKEVKACL